MRKAVLSEPIGPLRSNWAVEVYGATHDDRCTIHRLLKDWELRQANAFFQSGFDFGDWLLIEFWTSDQDAILNATITILEALKLC